MKIFKLGLAAALAVSSLTIAVAPAAAQRGDNMEQRDGMRGDNDRHDGMRGDNGRHNGWNNNRGRHNGWRRQRVCQTVYRHHHRQRVCHWVNRRWR